LKIFTDVVEMNQHSHCRVWSCRFLKSFDDVTADNEGPPLYPDYALTLTLTHHCRLCGIGYRTPHEEHAQNQHQYRSCNQEFYTSGDAFLQHLHNFHGASHPATLQGSSVVEQNFMRNKGASFEPIEFNESWQPCLMDLDTAPIGFTVERPSPIVPANTTKVQGQPKKSSSVRKKPHEEMRKSEPKAQRQRPNTTIARAERHGPRFFRLSTLFPFRSSRVFYSHNATSLEVPKDQGVIVEEMPQPSVAALVMSAGLVSMAAVRLAIKPAIHSPSGMVELTLDDAV
jgi:hypothetical protein